MRLSTNYSGAKGYLPFSLSDFVRTDKDIEFSLT